MKRLALALICALTLICTSCSYTLHISEVYFYDGIHEVPETLEVDAFYGMIGDGSTVYTFNHTAMSRAVEVVGTPDSYRVAVPILDDGAEYLLLLNLGEDSEFRLAYEPTSALKLVADGFICGSSFAAHSLKHYRTYDALADAIREIDKGGKFI